MDAKAANLVFLNQHQLAELIGVPVSTVAYWRVTGRGPKFSRLGKHIRYLSDDVAAWAEQNSHERT